MAKEDNKSKIKSTSKLSELTQQNKETLFGIDAQFDAEDRDMMDEISDKVKGVKEKLTNFTGPNVIDFMNSVNHQSKTSKAEERMRKLNSTKEGMKQIVEENQQGVAKSLLAGEANRVKLYDSYEILISYIPKLGKAVQSIVDAILSPDNLTDTSLTFKYSNEVLDRNNRLHRTIYNNLDILRENYDIDSVAYKAIHDSLIYGDVFYLKLNMDKQFNEILLESASQEQSKLVLEDKPLEINFTKDEYKLLNEEYNQYKKENSIEEFNKVNWDEFFDTIINENVIIDENRDDILEESTVLYEKFDGKGLNEFTKGLRTTDNLNPNGDESITKGRVKSKGKDKDLNINLGGTVMREIDRKRIIKIYYDGVTYGYFYIKEMDSTASLMASGNNTNDAFRNAYGYMNNTSKTALDSDDDYNAKMKKNVVMNMFTSKLADKLDSKYLKDNPQFKNLVYNLVSMDYFTKKKVKVLFLGADEVEHFYPRLGNDGYGISILSDALLLGTIYITTMVTTLMQKMIRSPQKRVFSIDVGYDTDYGGVVNEFVKSIKTSDVKFNGKDISSVLKQIGIFQDIFIPTVQGETPIQIDTLDGLDADINDDFLEYLLKEIIDSIGVPPSFIESVGEIDFAREITVQNANFVRRVISLQKEYSKPLNSLVHSLYKNEFHVKDAQGKTRVGDENMEYRAIEVVLPKPISLMLNTITETISSVKDTIEFVSEVYMGENVSEKDEDKKKTFKRNLAKHYFTVIDWAEMDEIFENSLAEATEAELTAELKKDKDDDEEDSGMSRGW